MDKFKKKMKSKMKQFYNNEYLFNYIRNEYSTDDNDLDIYYKVYRYEDLFDTRTLGHQIALRQDFFDYIEYKTEMAGNFIPINLHIIGMKLSGDEKGVIRHLIKEHYSVELYKIQKEYRKLVNKSLNMIFIGEISLALYFIIESISNSFIPSQIFGFLFSFSLWEAFDTIFYKLPDIRKKRNLYAQGLLTKVDYHDEDEEANEKQI